MKNTFVLLLPLYFFIGCHDQESTHTDTVTNYYKTLDAADYNTLKLMIHDSITISEGVYTTTYNHESYHELFRWDSIFKPSYNLTKLKEKSNQMIVSVVSNSLRYEFLKNNPLTCQYKISFTSGKISKIEVLECTDVDWDRWLKERGALINWVSKNQPQLNGFINDLTIKGALNYLKAIELYENDKNAL